MAQTRVLYESFAPTAQPFNDSTDQISPSTPGNLGTYAGTATHAAVYDYYDGTPRGATSAAGAVQGN